jgi:hypothetical protein
MTEDNYAGDPIAERILRDALLNAEKSFKWMENELYNYCNWSRLNFGEIVAESDAAEDFAFLCQCGITPDLTLMNVPATKR